MSNTLQQPSTPQEQAEVDYGEHVIWKMVGARITTFGANADGEIFLCTERDGETMEVIIGKDENGDIALFEVEKKEVTA